MRSATEYLRHSVVRQNGRIFPFGVIRTLDAHIQDDPEENDSGLELWSEDLVKYGDGKHYAETKQQSGDKLFVFNKETRMEVTTILFSNIFVVDIWTCEVVSGGFLETTGSLGGMFDSDDILDKKDLIVALNMAYRGKSPPYCDNSTFIKVDSGLVGQSLINLDLGDCFDPSHRVFTLDGKLVECEVGQWLSYARWKPKHYLAEYS